MFVVSFCVCLFFTIICTGDAFYSPSRRDDAWWETGVFGVFATGAVGLLIKLVV